MVTCVSLFIHQMDIFIFSVGHLVRHSNIFCRTFIKNVRLSDRSDEFRQHWVGKPSVRENENEWEIKALWVGKTQSSWKLSDLSDFPIKNQSVREDVAVHFILWSDKTYWMSEIFGGNFKKSEDISETRLREVCRSDGQIRQKFDRYDKTYVFLGPNVRHCQGPNICVYRCPFWVSSF